MNALRDMKSLAGALGLAVVVPADVRGQDLMLPDMHFLGFLDTGRFHPNAAMGSVTILDMSTAIDAEKIDWLVFEAVDRKRDIEAAAQLFGTPFSDGIEGVACLKLSAHRKSLNRQGEGMQDFDRVYVPDLEIYGEALVPLIPVERVRSLFVRAAMRAERAKSSGEQSPRWTPHITAVYLSPLDELPGGAVFYLGKGKCSRAISLIARWMAEQTMLNPAAPPEDPFAPSRPKEPWNLYEKVIGEDGNFTTPLTLQLIGLLDNLEASLVDLERNQAETPAPPASDEGETAAPCGH